MSLYDWLLFLHVLSAFSLVAAVVVYSFLTVASLRAERADEVARTFRILRAGDVLSIVGAIGTFVLGIWLALEVDGYELWDGWIVAALVIWLAAGGLGDRLSRRLNLVRSRASALLAEGRDERTSELDEAVRPVLVLQAAFTLLVLLLLLDMIWKPGA